MTSIKAYRKEIIGAVFITSLVVSNVVAGRIIMIFGLITPGAFVLYAFTFLMTDLMSELYGRKAAGRLVLLGFICSIFAASMILLTGAIKPAPFAMDQAAAYKVILGMNWRIVMASMVAYYISQSWDIWMFHLIGQRTGGKHKWLRNNLSTMSSQAIDTVLFILLAFSGVLPHIGLMIVSQYVLKLAVAALDTPIFYLLTRGVVLGEKQKAAA